MEQITKQYLLTVAAGKRLLAKAVLKLDQIQKALKEHTIVVISGSTNGYVAEELLAAIGRDKEFSKKSFLRGANIPLGAKLDQGEFSRCDVVIEKGVWQKGKYIHDVAESLRRDDIIIKGANAVSSDRKTAGIQIGSRTNFGTCDAIMKAVDEHQVGLVIPVGLEKRVPGDIDHLSELLASPTATGPRLLPVTGTIITELEAVEILLGLKAELVAAGGILGAEGGIWIAVTGTEEQLNSATELLKPLLREPLF